MKCFAFHSLLNSFCERIEFRIVKIIKLTMTTKLESSNTLEGNVIFQGFVTIRASNSSISFDNLNNSSPKKDQLTNKDQETKQKTNSGWKSGKWLSKNVAL